MSNTAISIENVSKSYLLGTIGTGTFRGDLSRWWAKQRGKPTHTRSLARQITVTARVKHFGR